MTVPFADLATDRMFWNYTLDGLAVMGADDFFQVYRVQRSVPELVVIADNFHIKPLVRIFQSADRYQILALDRKRINLYEGNRDVLDEIQPATGVPRTIEEALGDQLTDSYLTVGLYGKGVGRAIYHGHGARKDEIDVDMQRFFRVVDRAVSQHHSELSGLPLILAALPEYHTEFRKLSRNPYLIDGGIEINPQALTVDELRQKAWDVVEPRYEAEISSIINSYQAAKGTGLSEELPISIANAAADGRVGTLLLEEDRRVPGRIIKKAGGGFACDLESRDDECDLLDDLGEMVLKTSGRVVIVPPERMPSQTGAAALFRY